MAMRRLTKDDKKIWHQVARTVRPLMPKLNPQEQGALRAQMETYIHLKPAPGPVLHRAQGALQTSADKKIRKGRVQINRKIDLHDMTRDQAFPYLVDQIVRAYGRGQRQVLVVTGKGTNLEGVLRMSLTGWLNSDAIRPLIASYAPAHIRHGGSGAFYVFLKRKAQ